MIVAELTAAIDAIGTTQTFYMSDKSFTTSATDTPAHTSFESRLVDPGDISISIYRDGPSGGASTLEVGELLLVNQDGELDSWKKYSFDGRPLVIRVGTGGSYPDDFVTIFRGTIASMTISWDQVIIDIRDKSYIFSIPILTNRYLGINVGTHGLEGTPNDIAGTFKPLCLGTVREISPPCVNTSLLIYQVNDGPVASIDNVYIRQAEQTRGFDYANSIMLSLATIANGTFATCYAEGLFRLNGVDGQVTANVTEQNNRSCANLLNYFANRSGLGSLEISQTDVGALDLTNPAQLGIYIDDDKTYLDAMNLIAQSIGAWFAFDTLGVLRMDRLEQASSHPIDVLHQYDILETPERTILQNEPTPIWSVAINHTPIYTVQTSGLVGTVTPQQLAFLSQAYRTATFSNSLVQTQFKLATSITVDTLLTNASDAATEAQRLEVLHGQVYDVFNVPIDIDRFTELTGQGLALGKELGLDLPRFDLDGGFSFVVLGISYQEAAKKIVVTLWGGNTSATAVPITVEAIGVARGVGAAFEITIVGGAGLAAGTGNALSNTSGVQAGAGTATGTGFAQANTGVISGTQGQPIGFLLLLTKAT